MDHDHTADHDHDHEHDHGHDHDYEHDHAAGPLGWLRELLPFGHGHGHGGLNLDNALETNERGIWALKMSLVGLGVTAALQLVVALMSGSVGLLADTIHNGADALTAVPLWLAFILGRWSPTRRYSYGYGRAEDVAGVIIVGVIFVSVLLAAYESIQKIIQPQPPTNLGWVAAASILGFLGNEVV